MRGLDLDGLHAVDAVRRLERGDLRAVEYVDASLGRVEERDGGIGAWCTVDRDSVSRKARAADAHRQSGRPIGALHGVPVGLQDIFDTADMPTEYGTALESGRQPRRDAVCVARLRAAGAIVLGKTTTTALGHAGRGRARNPADPDRAAGDAGGGSAAAVAGGMVPVALAMQSCGSVTWSASCCGVIGYKPSHGLVPRTGVLRHAAPLDSIGVLGRSVEDVALVADTISGHDAGDADTRPSAPPRLLELARSRPPLPPLFAFAPQSGWAATESATAKGFAELGAELGELWDDIELPDMFADGIGAHRAVLLAGLAHSLGHYQDRGGDSLDASLREMVAQGRSITAASYLSALDWREVLYSGLEKIFERYDVVVTPAAAGEAPGYGSLPGGTAFGALWTLLGVPAISLPLLEGPNGLPVGVQLVGRRGYDGRLLRTAHWLCTRLAGAQVHGAGAVGSAGNSG